MEIKTGHEIAEKADEGNYNFINNQNPHKLKKWVLVNDMITELNNVIIKSNKCNQNDKAGNLIRNIGWVIEQIELTTSHKQENKVKK